MTRLGGPVPHRNRPSTYLWSQLIQPLQATINSDDPEVLARVGFAMSQLLGDSPAAQSRAAPARQFCSGLTENRLAWVHCHAKRSGTCRRALGDGSAECRGAPIAAARRAGSAEIRGHASSPDPGLDPSRPARGSTRGGGEVARDQARLSRQPCVNYSLSPAFTEQRRQALQAAGLSE